jgi:hypothetical protein
LLAVDHLLFCIEGSHPLFFFDSRCLMPLSHLCIVLSLCAIYALGLCSYHLFTP